jgi:uncharacterized protein YecE (DUF72 family)
MPAKRANTAERLHFRLDPALIQAAESKAKTKGHRTVSAYFRSLVEKDLRALPDEDRLAAVERIMGANHLELTRLIRSVMVAQRAQYMLFDSAIKALLSYLPDLAEPPDLANARGKARYDRVVRVAEQGTSEVLDQLLAELDRRAASRQGKAGGK